MLEWLNGVVQNLQRQSDSKLVVVDKALIAENAKARVWTRALPSARTRTLQPLDEVFSAGFSLTNIAKNRFILLGLIWILE